MTRNCDHCDKPYNSHLNQRFWNGEWDVEGIEETLKFLCNGCHRKLIREN